MQNVYSPNVQHHQHIWNKTRTTKLASEAPHPFHKILNHRIHSLRRFQLIAKSFQRTPTCPVSVPNTRNYLNTLHPNIRLVQYSQCRLTDDIRINLPDTETPLESVAGDVPYQEILCRPHPDGIGSHFRVDCLVASSSVLFCNHYRLVRHCRL